MDNNFSNPYEERKCPKCKNIICRGYGNNQMFCFNCKALFLWKDAIKFKNKQNIFN